MILVISCCSKNRYLVTTNVLDVQLYFTVIVIFTIIASWTEVIISVKTHFITVNVIHVKELNSEVDGRKINYFSRRKILYLITII